MTCAPGSTVRNQVLAEERRILLMHTDRINKIHLIGAYGVPEILDYQRTKKPSIWNYPSFFPFWEFAPGLPVAAAESSDPDPGAMLVVLNLNQKVWETLAPRFARYKTRLLVQMEAFLGWELAYEVAPLFETFMNFDPTYSQHPGFVPINLPYEPAFASSHRDQRGWRALLAQWRHSRRMFLSIYATRYLPRKKKAVMVATLSPQERYQVRLRAAKRWQDFVDVYGRGWPKDLPNYRGVCMSKADVFRRYRYALVFENQCQPGYVTEKFLDCLLDGTVPIYWGDPTLERRLPAPMLYPIADENAPLETFLNDAEGYRQRRAAILEHREKILAEYSLKRFTRVLGETFRRYTLG